MDGMAGVASGGGDDPEGGGSASAPSTPRPTANPRYVCLRSLVGATSSTTSASHEAMPRGARKVLDVGARRWVPVASDGSSGSDTEGVVGSPSSPAATLLKPLLRGRSLHGLRGGGGRDAELQIQARERHLQPHPLDYEPHSQVFEPEIQCSTPNIKEELAITIDRAQKELEYEKRQKVVEEISNNVKDISVKSSGIADCLNCLSSHVNQELAIVRDSREAEQKEDQERQKVVAQISSDINFFAATSGVIAEHLESLSSRADEILQIKIEERAKRETEEKSQKADANYRKECQSMLSDFVFFVLAFIPWILHKNEKAPSAEFYALTFSASGLALFGMGGYVLSHLARTSKWIKAVYWISGIAVMATILLVVYGLFELIPPSFKHMTFAFWVYLSLYLGVGMWLLVAWIRNFYQA